MLSKGVPEASGRIRAGVLCVEEVDVALAPLAVAVEQDHVQRVADLWSAAQEPFRVAHAPGVPRSLYCAPLYCAPTVPQLKLCFACFRPSLTLQYGLLTGHVTKHGCCYYVS
jgi:hypothetical protein